MKEFYEKQINILKEKINILEKNENAEQINKEKYKEIDLLKQQL